MAIQHMYCLRTSASLKAQVGCQLFSQLLYSPVHDPAVGWHLSSPTCQVMSCAHHISLTARHNSHEPSFSPSPSTQSRRGRGHRWINNHHRHQCANLSVLNHRVFPGQCKTQVKAHRAPTQNSATARTSHPIHPLTHTITL